MKKIRNLILTTVFLFTSVGSGFARDRHKTDEPVSVNATIPAPVNAKDAPDKETIVKNTLDAFEYHIGTENVLQIDVYYGKGERISQKVRVSSRGIITFPLVGEVEVAGLTVSGLQDKLTELLGKDYLVNPQVTVFIEEYSTVSILGEVNKPSVYPIKGRVTVLELISLAEGFTKIAAPNKVKVMRILPDGSREEIQVRVSDIINKDRGDEDNVVLRAGDMVVVPESFF
jgi:polysaccharide export outer membrane protein